MKFVIFAHARSGSTSFERFLPSRILSEPFHPDAAKWNGRSRTPRNLPELHQHLRLIFNEYDGLRSLNFHLRDDLNFGLFEYPTVFLRRKNMLKAAISLLIAQQTGVWESWEEENIEERYSCLQPIPKPLLFETANRMQSRMDLCQSKLKRSVLLYYEDLQDESAVANVCDFLEISLEDCNRSALATHHKLNTPDRYAKIPNWSELKDVIA